MSLDGPYAASDYPEVEFRWGADVQTAQSVTALGGQWTHHYEIRSWPRNGVACPATTIGPIFNNNGCVWSSDRAISGENSTSHTLAAGTEYLWQVRSVIAPAGTGWPSGKADATVGAWSAARSFTSAPRLHPPELESPANGELFSASVVELKWRRNACPVDSYEFAFSIAAWPLDGPDPTRLPESSSSHTIAVVTNSDYHWRMRSRKSGMDPSPWSPTRYFKVKQKGK